MCLGISNTKTVMRILSNTINATRCVDILLCVLFTVRELPAGEFISYTATTRLRPEESDVDYCPKVRL